MNDVTPLIRRITEDLRTLQDAMQGAKNEQLPADSHEDLLEEIINARLAGEFKSVIDEMRHFLWRYIENFATEHHSGGPHTEVGNNRLQLVSEMLQSLSQRAAVPVNSTLPPTMSFFERIDSVVSTRLQTGGLEGKLERDVA